MVWLYLQTNGLFVWLCGDEVGGGLGNGVRGGLEISNSHAWHVCSVNLNRPSKCLKRLTKLRQSCYFPDTTYERFQLFKDDSFF